jgi:homoserine O-succinyltransferase/O-acetyltransferase
MRRLAIALVSTMPDTALTRTARQFRSVLERAAEGVAIDLRVFVQPDVARQQILHGEQGLPWEPIEALWSEPSVHGLIVTGAEPQAPGVEDEPLWPLLSRLIAWADDHTVSTMLSCQAAHAAVFFFDGIRRRSLRRKLFGLYGDSISSDHPLMAGLPQHWPVPQSRHNDIDEAALTARSYRILSRSAEAGADIFMLERKSLFLFIQGHPEYERDALLREYRRDIRRFLSGEREDYPDMPEHYFTPAAAAAVASFAARAQKKRDIALLAEFPAVQETALKAGWDDAALLLYRNWQRWLISRKVGGDADLAGAERR